MEKNNLSLSLKSLLCGALISSFCWVMPLSASAQSSTSGIKSAMSALGYNYTAYNTVLTGKTGSTKYARAYTDVDAEQNLPGGYMGARPMLYDSSGNVAASGTWSYSSANTSGISRGKSYEGFSGTPSYYSQGYARIWMGTDYWTYGTFASPCLNDYT